MMVQRRSPEDAMRLCIRQTVSPTAKLEDVALQDHRQHLGNEHRADERQHEREIEANYRKVRNLQNNYLQDREEQRHETFTGMGRTFLVHDSCATESMGAIYDRSQEHLGVSDRTVIAVRKFLLQCIRDAMAGKEPPHLIRDTAQNDLRHLACVVAKIPSSEDPKQFVAEQLEKEKNWETASE